MKKRCTACVSAMVGIALVLSSCGGTNAKTIKRMQQLEEGVSSPTTEAELKAAIQKYQTRVEDMVLANQQIGIWYKMLGSRYLDNQMYGEALEAFRMATTYYPANQNLYYYVAVCAGYMANQSLDYSATGSTAQKFNYLKLAESAYLEALKIDSKYARALYGIGVLYIFELDEPGKAIPYLETLSEVEKRNVDGMFLLANAYYQTFEFEKAMAVYDKIISTTTSDEKKAQAEANKRQVLEAAYAG
ncbi:MAG: tetratricopeptide repeat protein [Spirochaetaceae bacterium]|nr:tetratricopeptide repeat protein [Spirochaetaceae bacterium]